MNKAKSIRMKKFLILKTMIFPKYNVLNNLYIITSSCRNRVKENPVLNMDNNL